MNLVSKLLATTLFAALFLTACGEKAEEAAPAAEEAAPAAEMATEEAAPAAEEAPAEAAPAAEESSSDEPGGYVPTEDELIPGITE